MYGAAPCLPRPRAPQALPQPTRHACMCVAERLRLSVCAYRGAAWLAQGCTHGGDGVAAAHPICGHGSRHVEAEGGGCSLERSALRTSLTATNRAERAMWQLTVMLYGTATHAHAERDVCIASKDVTLHTVAPGAQGTCRDGRSEQGAHREEGGQARSASMCASQRMEPVHGTWWYGALKWHMHVGHLQKGDGRRVTDVHLCAGRPTVLPSHDAQGAGPCCN